VSGASATEARPPRDRVAGVLLHPTSLPGPHGIGDLGTEASAFVDLLARAEQRLWQILPIGPTGAGDSPYAARSALAGNPLLISLEALVPDGLLTSDDLVGASHQPSGRVDYRAVARLKLPLLRRAYESRERASPALRAELEEIAASNAVWLHDWALYAALRERFGGKAWHEWPPDLAAREVTALAQVARDLRDEVGFHRFVQLLFFRQWRALRGHARSRGIRIIGDMPIFVAHDSADVWARPDLFMLDGKGRPRAVAGVPPDYFSATGQLWGNPVYDWKANAQSGYDWWIERVRAALETVDIIRLDHFRGFHSYWEVPAGDKTAVGGRWVSGPREALFAALERALGPVRFIAEDLGFITPDVDALREKLGYPGMRVLLFAFGDNAENPYLPHNYEHNTVAYTGTHDNDTVRGWYETVDEHLRHRVRVYLATDGRDIAWDFIRAMLASVADWAVIPAQDLLGLGNEARMNLPGKLGGNWDWRLRPGQLTDWVAHRLAEMTRTYGRVPRPTERPRPDGESGGRA
jgi:4-alpha-glucanotransferase